MNWLREAISDETGQADIAYAVIGALAGGALGSLAFICGMSAIAYFRCIPLVKPDVVVNCSFDPLPMGQAAALIFGAFATLIGALCGYMVATRKQRSSQPDQTVIANSAVVHQEAAQPAPAEAATDLGPPTVQKPRKGKR